MRQTHLRRLHVDRARNRQPAEYHRRNADVEIGDIGGCNAMRTAKAEYALDRSLHARTSVHVP